MYPNATTLIELPVALIFVNLLYLIQALLAYFYVEYLKLRSQLVDTKLVMKHEMYDWAAKFQISGSNLRFFRRSGWSILFFCFLAFGATIALQELFRSKFGAGGMEKTVVVILSSAILDVGLYYTLHYQFELRRERLNSVKLQIIRGYNMKNAVFLRDSIDQIRRVSGFFVNSSLTMVMVATIVMGYLTVLFFTLAT
jgi:hypothetical protein